MAEQVEKIIIRDVTLREGLDVPGVEFSFLQRLKIATAFNTWFWPLLGLIFLPWTTLMYAIVYGGGISGFDWVWLGLALLADIAGYVGGAARRKDASFYTGP